MERDDARRTQRREANHDRDWATELSPVFKLLDKFVQQHFDLGIIEPNAKG